MDTRNLSWIKDMGGMGRQSACGRFKIFPPFHLVPGGATHLWTVLDRDTMELRQYPALFQCRTWAQEQLHGDRHESVEG